MRLVGLPVDRASCQVSLLLRRGNEGAAHLRLTPMSMHMGLLFCSLYCLYMPKNGSKMGLEGYFWF